MRATRGAGAPPSPGFAPFLLLSLFLAGGCWGQNSFKLPYPINNIAVSKSHVFIATENNLYQLDPSLQQQLAVSVHASKGQDPKSSCQSGATSKEQEPETSCHPSATGPVNKLLIVHETEDTLFSCWNLDQGLCQRRNLSHIDQVVADSTHLVSCHPQQSTAGLLLSGSKAGTSYLLLATSNTLQGMRCFCPELCQNFDKQAISIWDTNFKPSNPENNKLALYKPNADRAKPSSVDSPVYFVDVLAWNSTVFIPYYPFNYSAGTVVGDPAVATLSIPEEFLALDGEVTLACHHDGVQRRMILASALIRGSGQPRGVWAGVFASESGERADRTALCLFNLSEIRVTAFGCDLKRFESKSVDASRKPCVEPAVPVNPISKSPTLVHYNLSSVYGIELYGRIVLFLGTGNGQLLKVLLDENMKADCPEVLYEIEEETPVFRKLEFNPVNQSYIYLPTTHEVKEIKAADCSKTESCKLCLSARDPYCGWCHARKRCTLREECSQPSNAGTWLNISEGPDQCLAIQVNTSRPEQFEFAIGNFRSRHENRSSCRVRNSVTSAVLCEEKAGQSTHCSCIVPAAERLKTDPLVAEVTLGTLTLSEKFQFMKCSEMQSEKLACSDCIARGCFWCPLEAKCRSSLPACSIHGDLSDQAGYCEIVGKRTETFTASPRETKSVVQDLKAIIHSVEPQRISTLGKSKVTVTGQNLSALSKLFLIGTSSCSPIEIPVYHKNDTLATLSLPPGRKELKSLCVTLGKENCSLLHYISLPSCDTIYPNTTWFSAGRNITIIGKNVDLIDDVTIYEESGSEISVFPGNQTHRHFLSPYHSSAKPNQILNLRLKMGGHHKDCSALRYLPDPKFTKFELHTDVDSVLGLTLTKEKDQLNITPGELNISISHKDKRYPCEVANIIENLEDITIHCKANKTANEKIDKSSVTITVILGNFTGTLNPSSSATYLYFLIVIPILLIVMIVAILITRHKSQQLSHKLSEHLEMLECEIRKEIRVGFAELQMDKLDVVDTSGTIPFLDYKHFALKTFFPESLGLSFNTMEEFCAPVRPSFQSNDPVEQNECVTALSALICNKAFLVNLIHTLEKQDTFTVKDRCLFASFLAVALHSKLVYLTQVLEVLTKDLVEQYSNSHPKLMLRHTELVMEKLLTNWMSICLYGFLRDTVGEPLYLLVTMLNQRIHKGPVDAITCKALYTLNEDWLLWQVTEFSPVTLNVVFPRISVSESEEAACEDIQVNVLDCDTIGQAKDKILQAFLSKNGHPFGVPEGETGLELHTGQQRKELLDIDSSSLILENGKTKLNTIRHYQISDGATINVLKKKTNCPSEGEYSDDYCHLILPQSEAAEESPGAPRKGKQKFKVKEMYLTKLLATKVAINSHVENLFRRIWTLPSYKAPVAIKYFFDLLDTQAEFKKITDPDVLHIWKTNSLPLRFWVNVIKNPQCVCDIKKTPHIDGCLSVIAQAFMDAFSLAEQHLGKEAPTNKLLYAKDIPLYKEEVKTYYKAIGDLPSLSSSELVEFLTQESKKHENEFKEDMALLELYKYISKYYDEILSNAMKEQSLAEASKQLQYVKNIFDEKKKCKWM
ncbi:plexin-C1 [Microcaecilia unicolor]|uniref:Plexin-C1 n=1 Tax=Microcaecilia unicolor TaxID=1415580 RepID=A0A6P7Z469_9AMPH|nr:plexin-C1 [Microcaecilia unicolor]